MAASGQSSAAAAEAATSPLFGPDLPPVEGAQHEINAEVLVGGSPGGDGSQTGAVFPIRSHAGAVETFALSPGAPENDEQDEKYKELEKKLEITTQVMKEENKKMQEDSDERAKKLEEKID